jgi:hypothetical protein
MADIPVTILEWSGGGYPGSFVSLALDGEILRYKVDWDKSYYNENHRKKEITITPTQAQWDKFREAIKPAISVKWAEKYEPEEEIMDGGGWQIHIAGDGFDIKSYGTEYPPQYSTLREALSDLTNGEIDKR